MGVQGTADGAGQLDMKAPGVMGVDEAVSISVAGIAAGARQTELTREITLAKYLSLLLPELADAIILRKLKKMLNVKQQQS